MAPRLTLLCNKNKIAVSGEWRDAGQNSCRNLHVEICDSVVHFTAVPWQADFSGLPYLKHAMMTSLSHVLCLSSTKTRLGKKETEKPKFPAHLCSVKLLIEIQGWHLRQKIQMALFFPPHHRYQEVQLLDRRFCICLKEINSPFKAYLQKKNSGGGKVAI